MSQNNPNGDEDSAEGNSDVDSNTLKLTALTGLQAVTSIRLLHKEICCSPVHCCLLACHFEFWTQPKL